MIKESAKAHVRQGTVLICQINDKRGKNAQLLPWNTVDYTVIAAEDQTPVFQVWKMLLDVKDFIYYSSMHFVWVNIRTVECIKKWLFIVSCDTVGRWFWIIT